MAVAHDVDSTANSGGTTVASLTWSHTSTGSNLLLVVGLCWSGSSATMSTITHAGNNPTGSSPQYDANTTTHARIWWWVNPTVGAQNIVATPSTTVGLFGGGTTFTGVDQSYPVTQADVNFTIGSSFGTLGTSLNVAAVNQMMYELIGMGNFTSTLAAAGGATESYNQGNTTIAKRAEAQYLVATTKGKYTMSQTISGSTGRAYSQIVLGINPVDNPSVSPTRLNNYQFVSAGDGMSVSEKAR